MLFSNLINLTYLTHTIHKIRKCLQNKYSAVDKLVATVKKVFLKGSSKYYHTASRVISLTVNAHYLKNY